MAQEINVKDMTAEELLTSIAAYSSNDPEITAKREAYDAAENELNGIIFSASSSLHDLLLAFVELEDNGEDLLADKKLYGKAIANLKDLIFSKVDSYARFTAKLDAREAEIQAEIDRLKGRLSETKERNADVKDTIKLAMALTGKKKIEGSLYTISTRATPPSLVIIDEDLVPGELWVTKAPKPPKPEIDKKRAKEFLKLGSTEWGKLETGVSLSIK